MGLSSGMAGRDGKAVSVPNKGNRANGRVIIDDFLLPAQFSRLWHQSRVIAPERLLAVAVLAEAVMDLQRFRFAVSRRQQRLYWEAYEWVASGDFSWPFSFRNLCDGLGLDSDATRADLLSLDRPMTLIDLAQAA